MKGMFQWRKKNLLSFIILQNNDFIISTEKDKKSSRGFLPGVERKKLRRKEDVGKSSFSDEISLIKNTPTPEIYRMDDEEDYEGGDTDENSHSIGSRKRRKKKKKEKRIYNDINQSEHSKICDENSMEIDSEDCKSDIQRRSKNNKNISPGKLFREKISEGEDDIIEDIPMSVFESSNSSNSDDTFESYENDELLIKLK